MVGLLVFVVPAMTTNLFIDNLKSEYSLNHRPEFQVLFTFYHF